VSALTLVATHAVAPFARVHHLVSWLLHLATSALFGLVLLRCDRRASVRPAQLFLTALFLLHPVGVESYVWINGRFDLLASLWLTTLLFLLSGQRSHSIANATCVFGVSLLGCLAKETFAPAALLVACAALFERSSERRTLALMRRRAVVSIVPTLLGIGVYIVLWSNVLPNRSESLGRAGNPLTNPELWAFVPKLSAIVSHALLSLRAAGMQSLSWDVVRSLSVAEWICGALGWLGLLALIWRRDWRGLCLVAAATTCVLPTLTVTSVVWLGLDRYLRMPMLLLMLAASPYAIRLHELLRAHAPRFLPVIAAVVLGVAATNTFVASRAYADQETWLASLLEERPEDPTVIVLVANELGEPRGGALLQHLPDPPWPSSVIAPLIVHALASKRLGMAQRVAEYGLRHYPTNSLHVALAVRVRYLSGETEAALALLPRLRRDALLCGEMREQLELWSLQASSPAQRSRLARALVELSCEKSSATPRQLAKSD
jgi:hypothetical protein